MSNNSRIQMSWTEQSTPAITLFRRRSERAIELEFSPKSAHRLFSFGLKEIPYQISKLFGTFPIRSIYSNLYSGFYKTNNNGDGRGVELVMVE